MIFTYINFGSGEIKQNTASEFQKLNYFNSSLWGKGKSVSLQAWSGPEGSKKLRFPDFMTTAQGSGKVDRLTHRPTLAPRNPPGTHFY
jgi:hypothetical protein